MPGPQVLAVTELSSQPTLNVVERCRGVSSSYDLSLVFTLDRADCSLVLSRYPALTSRAVEWLCGSEDWVDVAFAADEYMRMWFFGMVRRAFEFAKTTSEEQLLFVGSLAKLAVVSPHSVANTAVEYLSDVVSSNREREWHRHVVSGIAAVNESVELGVFLKVFELCHRGLYSDNALGVLHKLCEAHVAYPSEEYGTRAGLVLRGIETTVRFVNIQSWSSATVRRVCDSIISGKHCKEVWPLYKDFFLRLCARDSRWGVLILKYRCPPTKQSLQVKHALVNMLNSYLKAEEQMRVHERRIQEMEREKPVLKQARIMCGEIADEIYERGGECEVFGSDHTFETREEEMADAVSHMIRDMVEHKRRRLPEPPAMTAFQDAQADMTQQDVNALLVRFISECPAMINFLKSEHRFVDDALQNSLVHLNHSREAILKVIERGYPHSCRGTNIPCVCQYVAADDVDFAEYLVQQGHECSGGLIKFIPHLLSQGASAVTIGAILCACCSGKPRQGELVMYLPNEVWNASYDTLRPVVRLLDPNSLIRVVHAAVCADQLPFVSGVFGHALLLSVYRGRCWCLLDHLLVMVRYNQMALLKFYMQRLSHEIPRYPELLPQHCPDDSSEPIDCLLCGLSDAIDIMMTVVMACNKHKRRQATWDMMSHMLQVAQHRDVAERCSIRKTWNALMNRVVQAAVKHEQPRVLKAVFDNRCIVFPRKTSRFANSPLNDAILFAHKRIVRLLLEYGFDVDQKVVVDSVGTVPVLTVAVIAKRCDVLKLLLEFHASCHAVDCNGDSPLHFAARAGDVQALKVLLRGDGNANLLNRSGDTPLLVACRALHLDVVSVLLGADARVDVRDSSGRTPVDVLERLCVPRRRRAVPPIDTAAVQVMIKMLQLKLKEHKRRQKKLEQELCIAPKQRRKKKAARHKQAIKKKHQEQQEEERECCYCMLPSHLVPQSCRHACYCPLCFAKVVQRYPECPLCRAPMRERSGP